MHFYKPAVKLLSLMPKACVHCKKRRKKRGGAEAEIQEMNGECEENVTSRLKCPVDHFILQDISKYVGSVQIYAHGL